MKWEGPRTQGQLVAQAAEPRSHGFRHLEPSMAGGKPVGTLSTHELPPGAPFPVSGMASLDRVSSRGLQR